MSSEGGGVWKRKYLIGGLDVCPPDSWSNTSTAVAMETIEM